MNLHSPTKYFLRVWFAEIIRRIIKIQKRKYGLLALKTNAQMEILCPNLSWTC
jgi:hypothetical protein